MARKLSRLKKQYDDLRAELQKECQHEALIESGYFTILNAFPPRRMCLVCGREEDGWGCGYQHLHNNSAVIKKFEGMVGRDEFYRFRDIIMWTLEDIVSARVLANIKNPRRKKSRIVGNPAELRT